MDKQQIISLIKEKIRTGVISRAEVSAAIDDQGSGGPTPAPAKPSAHKLINIFYGIGAIIVLVGVIILIVQHWAEIGFLGRVAVTAGLAIAAFVIALWLKGPEQRVVAQIFFTLSAALAPVGVIVFLREADIVFGLGLQVFVALALLALFGLARLITGRSILVFLMTAFGSWAYYALLLKLLALSFNYNSEILRWLTLLLGLAYILIAYSYGSGTLRIGAEVERERVAVKNILYGLGTLAVLGVGLSLGGVWDVLFVAFIFVAFYASIWLKSRMILILSALFLMGYIAKLTSQYFVDSLGWPVVLVGCGLAIIGIGYITFRLNKRYLPQS